MKHQDIISESYTVPVTLKYPVNETKNSGLPNPGYPRLYEAADNEHPHGSSLADDYCSTRSVLQKHVDFFDRNKDGIITMTETYEGFRAIGFNPIFSLLAVLVIHPGFSIVTNNYPWYFPFDPLMRINVNKVHRAKHGSDTGVFDTEGRFVPQKFEEIFSKYERTRKGFLTFSELLEMTQHLWNVLDFFGWFASKFEWITVYLLTADKDGLVSKENIRRIYDGTLFYEIEGQNNRAR